jgi:hypothetical protein
MGDAAKIVPSGRGGGANGFVTEDRSVVQLSEFRIVESR